MSKAELARLRNSLLSLFADMEAERMRFARAGNGRAANGVVASMRIVRRWSERAGLVPDVDVDLNDTAPDGENAED